MAERDHIAEARARIEPLALYRTDPVLEAFMRPMLEDLNRIESVFTVMLAWAAIDENVGIALDVIGGILGAPRPEGSPDSIYKRFLKAAILANKSGTTFEDVNAVARQIQVRAFAQTALVVGTTPFWVSAVIPGLLGLEISLALVLLQRAIGQTDKLFLAAPAEGEKFFSFDTLSQGFDEAEWAPLFSP